jgi:hypothetical protein
MPMQSTRALAAAARVISKIFFPSPALIPAKLAVTVPAGTPRVRSRRD